jgi:hypothetical protein
MKDLQSKLDLVAKELEPVLWDLLDEIEENKEMEKDLFGFEKAIEIDHLTNEQVDEIFNMFGDK